MKPAFSLFFPRIMTMMSHNLFIRKRFSYLRSTEVTKPGSSRALSLNSYLLFSIIFRTILPKYKVDLSAYSHIPT